MKQNKINGQDSKEMFLMIILLNKFGNLKQITCETEHIWSLIFTIWLSPIVIIAKQFKCLNCCNFGFSFWKGWKIIEPFFFKSSSWPPVWINSRTKSLTMSRKASSDILFPGSPKDKEIIRKKNQKLTWNVPFNPGEPCTTPFWINSRT